MVSRPSKTEFLTVEAAKARSISWPDVYFTPAYGWASEASDSAEWQVAIWSNGAIVYPFLKRMIAPPLVDGVADRFDIVSPYGYSGTWTRDSVRDRDVAVFRKDVRDALKEQGAVAEFQRLSPLVAGGDSLASADDHLTVREVNSTIGIDLDEGYMACWNRSESRSRTKVRKARKLGYEWSSWPATPVDLAAGSPFRSLYERTMKRVGSDAYYLFPQDYYSRLQTGLGEALHVLHVRQANEVRAVGLFMVWRPFVHLHLAATEPQAARDGAGNLLYDGLIRWACSNEYSLLHIGGGLEKEDHLFYFKRQFGGQVLPFRVAQCVFDESAYAIAVKNRARALNVPERSLLNIGHFPAYRARRS